MNLKNKKILILLLTIIVSTIDLAYAICIFTGIVNLETSENALITNNSQALFLATCVIINLISIPFIRKNMLEHKKTIITLNLIQLFLGNLFNIISGIINITLISTKTKDIEESKKEKNELPILEEVKQHNKLLYFIIFVFLLIICYTPAINLLPIPNTKIATIITVSLLYIIQIVSLVIPMIAELKRDFIAFKNNFKTYISNMLPRFGIILIVYAISNFLIVYFVANISTNQEIIYQWPIYISAFIAIIIAPLTEELMFRGFMKKFIKNDILFILLSSLIFGGLHVTLADSFSQLLFIIPYSILGFAFSLNYVKTRNIVSNIFLHCAWNSIAIIAMIITKLI